MGGALGGPRGNAPSGLFWSDTVEGDIERGDSSTGGPKRILFQLFLESRDKKIRGFDPPPRKREKLLSDIYKWQFFRERLEAAAASSDRNSTVPRSSPPFISGPDCTRKSF